MFTNDFLKTRVIFSDGTPQEVITAALLYTRQEEQEHIEVDGLSLDNQLDIDWYRLPLLSVKKTKRFRLDSENPLLARYARLTLVDEDMNIVGGGGVITHNLDPNARYYLAVTSSRWDEIRAAGTLNYTVVAEELVADTIALDFTQNPNGTYIFANNHEAIRQENVMNLTDEQQSGRSWLMNGKNLKSGEYVMFISHNNETSYRTYADQQPNADPIFLALNVRFTKTGNASVILEDAGYWTSTGKPDETWSAIPAFAQYFRTNIWTKEYAAETLRVKAETTPSGEDIFIDVESKPRPDLYSEYKPNYLIGETGTPLLFDETGAGWVSDYLLPEQYVPCEPSNALFMMLRFRVVNGEGNQVNYDIGAFKVEDTCDPAAVKTVNGNVADGSFVPHYAIKGVSHGLPEVDVDLSYTLTESTSFLPVEGKVVSQDGEQLEPRVTEEGQVFASNLNPFEDKFNLIWAATDMLDFEYKNPDGTVNYFYGARKKTDQEKDGMGNYGVVTSYNFNILNPTRQDKQFAYELTTSGDYLVRIKEKDGTYKVLETKEGIEYTMVSRNQVGYRFIYTSTDGKYTNEERYFDRPVIMATYDLPANELTEFTLEVICTTNVNGGIKHRFLIENQ